MTYTETTTPHGLYRYRPLEDRPGFELEYWHEVRGEWRAVRNISSRDFFAIGFQAGRESQKGRQVELFA